MVKHGSGCIMGWMFIFSRDREAWLWVVLFLKRREMESTVWPLLLFLFVLFLQLMPVLG